MKCFRPSAPEAWAKSTGRAIPGLNREVALKILPDIFANDPDRVARFARDAQVLASLNHPYIAQVHGLELIYRGADSRLMITPYRSITACSMPASCRFAERPTRINNRAYALHPDGIEL